MFSLHDWVKRGFVSAINSGQSEYWIILTATSYLEKGVLTEADLAELQALKAEKEAKNAEEAKAAIAAQKVKPITGKTVEAPLPGRIVDICVKVGDKVKRGDTIAILEAMKMENSMTSNYEGTVKQILVEVGQAVAAGTILAEVE